jgi:hypothetical protein
VEGASVIRVRRRRGAFALAAFALTGLVTVPLAACTVVHAPAKAKASWAGLSPSPVASVTGRIPATARVITFSMVDRNARTLPAPVTITDPVEVSKIVALINGLPKFPPGIRECGPAIGSWLGMTFRATLAGPVLAVATPNLLGCGAVAFSVGGSLRPTAIPPVVADRGPQLLGPLNGGFPLAKRIVAVAGLNWKLSSYTFY